MKQILSRHCPGACKQFANVMQTVSFPQWYLGCYASKLCEQPAGPGLETFLSQSRDVAESWAALYGTGLSVNVYKAVTPCALLRILMEIQPSLAFGGAWDGGKSAVQCTAASCQLFCVDVLGMACHGPGKRDAGAVSQRMLQGRRCWWSACCWGGITGAWAASPGWSPAQLGDK